MAMMKEFLHGLPKTELHVHLEGTIEPEMVINIAKKNNIKEFEHSTAQSIKKRMGDARDLLSFIQVYEQMLAVLKTEEDFYEVAMNYFRNAHKQGVVYVEMFFDPQMHTTRGIPFETIMKGLKRAKEEAKQMNMQATYIMCFNRDKSPESAMEHLKQSLPFNDLIIGIGTDNPEHTGFPDDFANVYSLAAQRGYRLTAHCDVNFIDSLDNIRGCFETLKVERIDHGIDILEDEELLTYARQNSIGFTVCPTIFYTPIEGEINTKYFQRCAKGAKRMLDAGLIVTLASDDPGVMCCKYVGDVYTAVQDELGLSQEDMVSFSQNGFEMAWISRDNKQEYLKRLREYVEANK